MSCGEAWLEIFYNITISPLKRFGELWRATESYGKPWVKKLRRAMKSYGESFVRNFILQLNMNRQEPPRATESYVEIQKAMGVKESIGLIL